jgi:hypothetical protein
MYKSMYKCMYKSMYKNIYKIKQSLYYDWGNSSFTKD